jgi:hypothetical protein
LTELTQGIERCNGASFVNFTESKQVPVIRSLHFLMQLRNHRERKEEYRYEGFLRP